MILRVYTDGGSLNNPGKAASAYLIYKNNQLLAQEGRNIGINTNNIAEYQALIMAWEKIIELFNNKILSSVKKIEFISDSLLMVNQMLGTYRVKDEGLKKRYLRVKELEKKINIKFTYKHVLREKNTQADALVKQAFYS
jgi:ribonuclease HI